MELTIELPEKDEERLRNEIKKEVKEEIIDEDLWNHLESISDREFLLLIKNRSNLYERYNLIKNKPFNELSEAERFILGLYYLIYLHFNC